MRIAFCGGGTGGHVYPALTVAAALRSSQPTGSVDLLYIGVRGKIDRELVEREKVAFRGVTAGPLRVADPITTAKGAAKLLAGTAESLRILREYHPNLVFATGGYGSVGVGIAARLLSLPLLLFLPDDAAGLAVKALVRLANRIAVTVPPALEAMPAAKTVLTGYPVRSEFFTANREESRVRLGLSPSLPTLLVAGGSTGATAINRNVATWLPDFLRVGQVLHVCGQNDESWLRDERERLTPDLRERYHLHPYLHEGMANAFAAADLGVLRAGASTLGELPAAALPAVLVPGEFSDQALNARYLESEGAASVLLQSDLDNLRERVMFLLADTWKREAMRSSLQRLARPDAASRLSTLVMEMASREKAVASKPAKAAQ